MQPLACLGRCALTIATSLALCIAANAKGTPLAGCYQQTYDAAHLAAHTGQFVVRLTLSVTPAKPQAQDDATHVADGKLRMWVRGRKRSFDSDGTCRIEGKGLLCLGSLAAADADTCKSTRDGVHDCRMGGSDAGSFRVVGTPRTVLVTIHERLELVPAPYDAGPFLYLSPTNTENHAFLLSRSTKCK